MESRLSQRKSLKANLGSSGFRTKKSLGQNFLVDEGVAQGIVSGSGAEPGDTVLEIGPGVGSLTRYLLPRVDRVIAVELDREAIPLLERNTKGLGNLRVIQGDILKTDLAEILEGQEGVKVIANLPYYITSPILMKLLEEGPFLSSITVMVQKEVGERLCAVPGTKDYGILTLAVGYYARVEKILDVGKECFHPVPKVDSVVMRLIPLPLEERLPRELEEAYFRLIKGGFAQRRKNLMNSLAAFYGADRDKVKNFLARGGIAETRRGETLSKEEYMALASLEKELKQ